MEQAEEAAVEARASRSPISVAILAAVACVPIVIAAGFLVDRAPADAAALPGDISPLALRGPFDAAADGHPRVSVRAGY